MILGFAHVVVGCDCNRDNNLIANVPSSREKWPFLRNRPISHDLVINFPGVVPIELVRHDTGLIKTRPRIFVIGRGYIEVQTRNRVYEEEFLDSLAPVEGGEMVVRSPVGNWSVTIGVVEDGAAAIDPPLDVMGGAALAFYSTDVEEDLDRLKAAGAKHISNPFAIEVRDRKLLIGLARSQEGTIVELVQVRTF
jgi:hypothetical protein